MMILMKIIYHENKTLMYYLPEVKCDWDSLIMSYPSVVPVRLGLEEAKMKENS